MDTKKWTLDKAHTQIQFRVKHLMITTVTGSFGNFDATVETKGDDFKTSKIWFTADTDSVSTGNVDRDVHIKSPDFFDVVTYPKLKFESSRVKKLDEKHFRLYGSLTIRNITKEIEMDVEFTGLVKDPWGKNKAGFNVSGKVDRRDFGLRWNVITEAGNILVGEEAKISCEVQLVEG